MKKQHGFSAVEGLIIVAVIAVVGFAGWFVLNRNNDDTQLSVDTTESVDTLEQLPTDLNSLKTVEEIEQIAGVNDEVSIVNFKLEPNENRYEYIVILSSGKKLVIDASSGEVLSEETTDVSDYTNKVSASISVAQAYSIASAQSSSPIKEIEFEAEDNRATYKIEYRDGSKIEIDATNGSILKLETKDNNESEDEYEDSSDEDSEDSHEDEDEHEDDSDDDSDEDEEDDDSSDNSGSGSSNSGSGSSN